MLGSMSNVMRRALVLLTAIVVFILVAEHASAQAMGGDAKAHVYFAGKTIRVDDTQPYSPHWVVIVLVPVDDEALTAWHIDGGYDYATAFWNEAEFDYELGIWFKTLRIDVWDCFLDVYFDLYVDTVLLDTALVCG